MSETKGRRWTDEVMSRLRHLVARDESLSGITIAPGRTVDAVRTKAAHKHSPLADDRWAPRQSRQGGTAPPRPTATDARHRLPSPPTSEETCSSDSIAPVTADRRGQPRASGPFEASWSGTSGHRRVRIADFSVAGCFVEDIAAPATGDRVTLTLRVPGGGPIEATGRVVYINPPLGFAVAFEMNDRLASELAAAAQRVSRRRS